MSDFSALKKKPNDLYSLLAVASVDDLSVLTDYITDSGEGRMSLDSEKCARLVSAAKRGNFSQTDREIIGTEVLLYGGNSVANAFRSIWTIAYSGNNREITITYDELVHDVAKQIGTELHPEASVQITERAILVSLFRKSLDTLDRNDRAAALKAVGMTERAVGMAAPAITAFSAAAIGAMVAGGVAKQVLGKTITFVAPALIPSVAAFSGPVGLVLGGLWSAAGLASPAYRITIPCVIQLAHMRAAYMNLASSAVCSACNTRIFMSSKFCTNCGGRI